MLIVLLVRLPCGIIGFHKNISNTSVTSQSAMTSGLCARARRTRILRREQWEEECLGAFSRAPILENPIVILIDLTYFNVN